MKHHRAHNDKALLTLLGIAVILCLFASILIGTVHLTPWRMLVGLFTGNDEMIKLVFWEIRLPRALLGMFVGFSLGLTGAVMQGFMRNPLADPGILGVTSGSAMGAVATFYFGLANLCPLALPLGGVLGGFIIIFLVVIMAGRDASVQTLILAGIAFSSLAGSIISLILNFSPNPHAAMDIMFWLLGSLNDRNLEHVYLALPLMLPGWIMLLYCSRALRALSLGEDTATSMGFSIKWIRRIIIIGSALAVGPAIAVTGSVGFIGLIVPHLMRRLVGGDPGRLLWVSGLAGAILLSLSDILVRIIPVSQELKLGVVTSLLGAPFFLFLILNIRKEEI